MKVRQLSMAMLLLWGIFIFSACKHEAPIVQEPGKYSTGIFIVNEGGFNSPGGISWHDPVSGETVEDAYATANDGAVLGQFVQSITFYKGKGYICVNGANKVVIVDAETFKSLGEITGFQLPRYFLVLDDNFALVSQWGADGLTGSLAKVDLRTNQIVKTIPTGNGPEKMLRRPDNTLLVPNSGGYGVDSTVSVIDLETETEQSRIAVPGKNPGSIALGHFDGDHYYVLCKGSYLDAVPAGWVGRLDDLIGADVPAYGEDLCADDTGNVLYFSAGGSVFRWIDLGLAPFIAQSAYGLTAEASSLLYCADAKDFSSKGEVVIYNVGGQKQGTFAVGIAPGEVIVVE